MTNTDRIIVAIDGFSSCGKSTLAKELAAALDYLYIDTGAMYRAVTLFFMQEGVDWNDETEVAKALPRVQINFARQGEKIRTQLNGKDVEDTIRGMEVSANVSPVATIPAVRRLLVAQQQRMGQAKGIVMDGRDIGTVVFPEAELKIFLTADTKERTRRRHSELAAKGQTTSWDDVHHNLTERDRIDSSRADSPLRQAADAVVVDNTNLRPNEQVAMVVALVRERGA